MRSSSGRFFAASLVSLISLAPLALPLAALGGCSAETPAEPDPSIGEDKIKGTNCQATFQWLQKDAYKETAGRTSKMWPPHTTTQVDVSCTTRAEGKKLLGSAFQTNYGTAPGAVDKNGAVFLVEVKRETITGSQNDLLALLDAYKACGCNPDKFLSMDTLKGALAEKLLGQFIQLVEQSTALVCKNEGGKAALVLALKEGNFDKALAIVPQCNFDGGSVEATMNQAMAEVAKASQTTLAEYHVCNNNAALQAELFRTFGEKRVVNKCTTNNPLCSGPKFFYDP